MRRTPNSKKRWPAHPRRAISGGSRCVRVSSGRVGRITYTSALYRPLNQSVLPSADTPPISGRRAQPGTAPVKRNGSSPEHLYNTHHRTVPENAGSRGQTHKPCGPTPPGIRARRRPKGARPRGPSEGATLDENADLTEQRHVVEAFLAASRARRLRRPYRGSRPRLSSSRSMRASAQPAAHGRRSRAVPASHARFSSAARASHRSRIPRLSTAAPASSSVSPADHSPSSDSRSHAAASSKST